MSGEQISIERIYPASAERVWELWTTPAGIESWWAPDGFEVRVDKIDVRAEGELVYTMTAVGEAQVDFMKNAGMPPSTESRKTFKEVSPTSRLTYNSLIDFVPGLPAYEHLTTVDFTPVEDGVRVVMTIEPLHDADWTQRIVAGRTNELDNLGALISG
ncbi:SRPBCC domain-containing protein [Nocardia sp. NPDC020380]|uniref:SRPBCC domain-containing protein n=1 Tax=Nocardia sp. NPDC020380 TaxID=3364309 RepID=UPI00378DA6B0